MLQIGLGGENLVRFARITNDLRHFNGRTGMGAVMGSKNLKAVAVRGSTRYTSTMAQDGPWIADFGKRLAKGGQGESAELGPAGAGHAGADCRPERGRHPADAELPRGAFEGVDNLRWEAYEKELLSARRQLLCVRGALQARGEGWRQSRDRYQVSDNYGGPEYEAVAGFGSNCGIDDLQAVAKANELCNRFTLDAISMQRDRRVRHGMLRARPDRAGGHGRPRPALRECGGHGPLCRDDRAPRRASATCWPRGRKRAAEVIGGDAPFFAMQVKGQELPMHDPRGKVGVGLSYATSETGAEHLTAFHDPVLANPDSLQFKGVAAARHDGAAGRRAT